MVYDEWFPNTIPTTWTKVAVLETATIPLQGPRVSIYVTREGEIAEVRALLRRFALTLPPHSSLVLAP
jgi:hypothetical protein